MGLQYHQLVKSVILSVRPQDQLRWSIVRIARGEPKSQNIRHLCIATRSMKQTVPGHFGSQRQRTSESVIISAEAIATLNHSPLSLQLKLSNRRIDCLCFSFSELESDPKPPVTGTDRDIFTQSFKFVREQEPRQQWIMINDKTCFNWKTTLLPRKASTF